MAIKTRDLPRNARLNAIASREADLEIRNYLEECYELPQMLTQTQINHRALCRWMYNRLDVMKTVGLGWENPESGQSGQCVLYPYSLENLGVKTVADGNRFIDFYLKVHTPTRSWVSGCQVNQYRVKAIALTPNYNRLPQWVREGLMEAPDSAQIGGDRIGNIWRLIPCVKAWKWAQFPKGVAEKIGKLSPRMRMLAAIAWHFRDTSVEDPEYRQLSQGEQVKSFWLMLQALESNTLLEQCEWGLKIGGRDYWWGAKRWASFLSESIGLPYGLIELPKEVTIEAIQDAIIQYASPAIACQTLFGVTGKATVKAFQNSDCDRWNWAKAIAYGDADAVQKILNLDECINYQPDAIAFLLSLPMQSRIRLLGSLTFKYKGVVHPISTDHVRDTGYLWNQLAEKPDLGRIRCWFSVHEALATEYVRHLPDEALPIAAGWERVDGLCSVNGDWEIELPKRVATLKYWGESQRHCVGGYGNAIKNGRSIIFAVREHGILTHTVEVQGKSIIQFYKAGNQSGDYNLVVSLTKALQQTELVTNNFYY